MGRLNGRHLDAQRKLTPRAYLADPYAFGMSASRLIMPPGGDDVSQLVAAFQHHLVRRWRAQGAVSAPAVQARFRIGRTAWSQTIHGHRWAGETVLTALVWATSQPR